MGIFGEKGNSGSREGSSRGLFRDPILRFSSIRLLGNVEGLMPDKELVDGEWWIVDRG
jgi:hypothetical protein